MKPFDREPNLFELPTVVCYCVGQGASRCAPCRARRRAEQDMQSASMSIGAFLAGPAARTLPAPVPAVAPAPNPWYAKPSQQTQLISGDTCPICFKGVMRPHNISQRLMCNHCAWGVGDIVPGTPLAPPQKKIIRRVELLGFDIGRHPGKSILFAGWK